MMPGVVSLPHGWAWAPGRPVAGQRQPGVSANDLTDERLLMSFRQCGT
jgi:hypothetical protein